MQIVALGKQDVYLTGNPQFTYFKVIYRRHTNFATESIMVHWDSNTVNPALGTTLTATIPRQADLVNGIWLQVVMPQDTAGSPVSWIDGVGNALVKRADIEIGGHLVDRHYGEWMNIWGELTTPQGKLQGYDTMVGNNTNLSAGTPQKLDIPLLFWFCRNPGLALPLVALQNTEVKLKIQLETEANLVSGAGTLTNPEAMEMKLWVDYVFLDTDERRRFAQVSHEYLIEQLQVNNFTVGAAPETTNKRCELWFDYPIKEFNWVIHTPGDDLFDFDNSFDTAKFELDSRVVVPDRRPEYYLQIENYTHHRRVPRYDAITGSNDVIPATDPVTYYRRQKIYTYSFALTPENHQPSGSANFTRIDTAVLSIKNLSNTQTVAVYATNYNILRFMAGAANLSFSV